MRYDNGYGMEEESPSLLGAIGSFLWKAIKFLAVAALVVTGLVLFSDNVSNWVDKQTGGPEKGIGTKIRGIFKPAKDGISETYDAAKKTVVGAVMPDKPSAEEKRERSEDQKLENMGVATAGVGLLAGARIMPHAVRAGVDATGHAISKIPLSDGAAGKAVSAIKTGISEAKTGLKTLLTPTSKAASAAKTATTATEAAIPLAGEATSFAKIGSQFAGKAAPFLKGGAKFLGPVGAGLTVYSDGGHAIDLAKEGKTGSAVTQTLSGAVEAGTMASMNPLAMAVGTAIKDWTAVGHMIVTGRNDVTPSALTSLVKETPIGTGLEHAGDKMGDAINWMNGRSDGQIAERAAKVMATADRAVRDKLSVLTEDDRERFGVIKENLKYHNTYENDTQVLLELVKERYPKGIGHLMPEGYSYLKGFPEGYNATPQHGLAHAANKDPSKKEKS